MKFIIIKNECRSRTAWWLALLSKVQRHTVSGVRLTGTSKLPIDVNVSLNDCVSVLTLHQIGDLSRLYPGKLSAYGSLDHELAKQRKMDGWSPESIFSNTAQYCMFWYIFNAK